MAVEAILRLRVDPSTGRKVIDVKYESDADALPIEHEQDHRAFVQKVLGEADRSGLTVVRPDGAPTIIPEDQQETVGDALGNKK